MKGEGAGSRRRVLLVGIVKLRLSLHHLNSRTVRGILRGPANAGGNNYRTVTVMRGCGSGASLEAFPHPAGIDCRDWHISRCRRACLLRK
jgi:hypothetical protein